MMACTSTATKYANGELPKLPLTTVELYAKIVDQVKLGWGLVRLGMVRLGM